MTNEQLQAVLIVITLLIAGWSLYVSYKKGETTVITPSGVLEAVTEAKPIVLELMEIAQVAVNSVEQLRREGKIHQNDVAFHRALDLTKKWVPDEWEVDNEDIVNAINAAVLVASALTKQAGASSERVP